MSEKKSILDRINATDPLPIDAGVIITPFFYTRKGGTRSLPIRVSPNEVLATVLDIAKVCANFGKGLAHAVSPKKKAMYKDAGEVRAETVVKNTVSVQAQSQA